MKVRVRLLPDSLCYYFGDNPDELKSNERLFSHLSMYSTVDLRNIILNCRMNYKEDKELSWSDAFPAIKKFLENCFNFGDPVTEKFELYQYDELYFVDNKCSMCGGSGERIKLYGTEEEYTLPCSCINYPEIGFIVSFDQASSKIALESRHNKSLFETYMKKTQCCEAKINYHSFFDSAYCSECKTWLEEPCEDGDCNFCVERPSKA